MRDADGLYYTGPVTRGMLRAMDRCKVIVESAIGMDTFEDFDLATEKGVVVCNCPDVFVDEVANQAMIPRKRGRIVNVIANIYRGFPGMVHTGAARAGVENMTMSLAVEWSQFGILVNAVAPGVIISSGTKRYPPEIVARSVSRTPLKRAGTVDEVAASIVFLASPAAQFITGTTLRIDGGQALWGDTWELP